VALCRNDEFIARECGLIYISRMLQDSVKNASRGIIDAVNAFSNTKDANTTHQSSIVVVWSKSRPVPNSDVRFYFISPLL
jgi:hypothetical protein